MFLFLQRLFGTTNYEEAATRARARYVVEAAAAKATRKAAAYEVKKLKNAQRNQKLREAGAQTKTLFTKDLKEHFGIMGKRAPSKPVLNKLFGTDDYKAAFERAKGVREFQRKRLGRLVNQVREDKQFFPIAELERRLEEQLMRLKGYDTATKYMKAFTCTLRSGVTKRCCGSRGRDSRVRS
jgi:hypothetical protein